MDKNSEVELLNFKRKLKDRRQTLNDSLGFGKSLFGVDGSEYVKKYDWLVERMEETYIEWMECRNKLNDIDVKLDKLKVDYIVENNIDVRQTLLKLKNRDFMLSELYKNGFISNEMLDSIKTYFWNERKGRMEYKLV